MKRTTLILIALVLAVGIAYAQKAPQGDEYKQWMQDVNQNNRAFTDAYNEMNMSDATGAIDALVALYTKMEAHWAAQEEKDDAVGWSTMAKEAMTEAQQKMRLNDIAYSLNLLEKAQTTCQPCHQAYRPQ